MQPMARSHAADADRVYKVLRADGVALVPLDVGYGLLAITELALRRVRDLAGRPRSRVMIIADAAIFDDVVQPLHPEVRRWLAQTTQITPLVVTTAFDPGSRLLATQTPALRAQTTADASIATLHNPGALVAAIATRAHADARLVYTVPATTPGRGQRYTVAEVPQLMRLGVDVIVDRGRTRYTDDARCGATVLDLETGMFSRAGINRAQLVASWASLWSRRLVA